MILMVSSNQNDFMITPGSLIRPRQHAGPTDLARKLLWVRASEVVLGFMAFFMQQLSSDPVLS